MDQRVTLITLGVADIARALAFYRDGLGWRPSGASVEGEVAFFQLNGIVLGLWSRTLLAQDARIADTGGWGGTALAHNVGAPEEVDRVVDRMVGAGGRLLRRPAPTEWGGYSGYVADPDGHPWEIAHNPHWPLGADGTLTLPE